MSAISALRGYRTQFLYSLHYAATMLRPIRDATFLET